MSMPGAVMSLSWNGSNPNTGIIWTARPDQILSKMQLVLHSFLHSWINNILPSKVRTGSSGIPTTPGDNQWHFQQVYFRYPCRRWCSVVSVLADQQHFTYLDQAGNIWNAFYKRGNPPLFPINKWDFQQINTNGHPSQAESSSLHFTSSSILSGRTRPAASGTAFTRMPITVGTSRRLIRTASGSGSIFVSVFNAADQQHFAYTTGLATC